MKNICWIILIIVVFLTGIIYFTRPTPDVLSHYSVSLDGLTLAQKKNICLAANRLNNIYIQPKKIFSFNLQTGPRTLENGFLPSRAILENDVIESVGGGICLVASTLYNAVLLADLDVIERKAHSKVVHSVPPGLDSTVWYGINDLKFRNNSSNKMRINTACDYKTLNINIMGSKTQDSPLIYTKKIIINPHLLKVMVFRKKNNSTSLISKDEYQL